MKFYKQRLTGFIAAVGMLVLILDTKAALSGAQDGVMLCLHSVIPSLFPFLVLSAIISNIALGGTIQPLQSPGQLLGIPSGAEYLLVISLVGGYPVGAQAVARAWHRGGISKESAHRLLGFCSNAGPAFIFGMIGSKFSDPLIAWILWLIHFSSGIAVGLILPKNHREHCVNKEQAEISIIKILNESLKSMAGICGWIVLFRTMIRIAEKHILWLFPKPAQVLICGLFELSNGCIMLDNLPLESTRFLISSILLSFGGLCVFMQTRSVTGQLSTGMYFPGKLLQALISFLLASILQHFLFPNATLFHLSVLGYVGVFIAGILLLHYLHRRKKVVAMST